MGSYDGSVVIQALLDATDVKKELDKLQKDTATSVGKWKVGFLAAGAAAAAVGVATVKIGKAAIDAYADYEQLIGGVDTLFKDSADTVKEYANGAYKTAGMSANAYMETVTGFSASLLQSLGGDTKRAWENLLVGFADGTQDLGLLMSNLVDSVGVVADSLIPRIGQVIGSLVEMLVSNAPQIAKVLVDLAVDIGKNIVAGLWRGIKASWGNFISHFEGKTQELIDSAKEDLDIHSPSGVFAEIGEYCMEGLAVGLKDSSGKVIKTQSALSKAIVTTAKQGAEELRKTNKATAAEEAEFWQELAKSSKLTAKEQSQVKVLAAKAASESSKESYEASKDWLDRQVSYNNMSTKELVVAWQRVVDRKNLQATEQAKANEQLLKAEKQLYSEAAEIEKEYENALDSRKSEIMGSFGLFEAAPEINNVSPNDLLGNMRNQQQVLQQWSDELAKLAARGLDESFMAEVRDKGPNALGELLALNEMSDEQVAEYAEMWQGLREQAGLAAAAELSGLREETDKQIADLLDGVEGQLSDESPDVGEALSDGLAEGILAGKSDVVNAAAAVAAAAVRAAKRELDIHSPSKKFRYLGEMSSAGFVGGIEGGAKQVKAAVSEMLSAVNLTPVVVESGRALTGGTTREIITNNRTVEKVARLEGDGLNNALVSRLRIKLQDEDVRVGTALGV